jgi:hypothetical protein
MLTLLAMPSDLAPNLVALRDMRERTIAQLSEAFAHDRIEVEDFERRLTLVHRASSAAEITQVVSDLDGTATTPLLSAPATFSALASVHDRQRMMAVLGGVERRGVWTPPRRLKLLALMGGIFLDFREASLLPGVTEVQVVALMGGVAIIVPPSLSVEVSGTAVMGGFEHVERVPLLPDPDRPVLRVGGLAVMGGVSVQTRLPGESERGGHRRRRHERRALDRQEPKRLLE